MGFSVPVHGWTSTGLIPACFGAVCPFQDAQSRVHRDHEHGGKAQVSEGLLLVLLSHGMTSAGSVLCQEQTQPHQPGTDNPDEFLLTQGAAAFPAQNNSSLPFAFLIPR